MTRRKPVVMVFSGSDPTSGAGLQADVLTVAELDCHPLTIVTSITIQNTREVSEVHPLASDLITLIILSTGSFLLPLSSFQSQPVLYHHS